MKLCIANELSGVDELDMLQKAFACGIKTLKVATWITSFWRAIHVKHRRKRQKVREMVLKNRHTSLRKVASELDSAYKTTQQHCNGNFANETCQISVCPKRNE